MTSTESIPDVEELARAVDAAIAAVDELDEPARSRAHELRAAIEDFHRPALVHIVQTLRSDPRGKELLFALVDDPLVRSVFGLHEIIRPDPATRANRALEAIRPYLHSHGGDVELVRIEAGAAVVRLQGSCRGCSMSAVTLHGTVEQALVEAVDEIDRIEALDDEPTSAFIPVESVGVRRSAETGWVAGPEVEAVPEGGMVRFDVGDDGFVVTNIDQRFAVFRNACVHQGLALDGGLIESGVLRCPHHGFTFDASTGECLSAPGAQLDQIPTRVEEGRVWARVGGT